MSLFVACPVPTQLFSQLTQTNMKFQRNSSLKLWKNLLAAVVLNQRRKTELRTSMKKYLVKDADKLTLDVEEKNDEVT